MEEAAGFFNEDLVFLFLLSSLLLLLAFANGEEERAREQHLVEIQLGQHNIQYFEQTKFDIGNQL